MNLLAIFTLFATLFLMNVPNGIGNYYEYETKFIDVAVDHFSFTDNRTFPLRYLVNDSFWRSDYGPIFFYTGNEGNIVNFAQNTGYVWEIAQKFKALIIFAEHRYYGVSMPFGKLSLLPDAKYFGYLTSQQALTDFVDLLYHLKWYDKNDGKRSEPLSNPVIAFGGSYGGMLAVWMRMKYPAVIEGALASSAPIWYFTGMTECDAFYRVVKDVFSQTSKNCVTNIKKSWHVIADITRFESGKSWISKNWKLCSRVRTKKDVSVLIEWVTSAYDFAAMINYPYSTNFLKAIPGYPVKHMCRPLSKNTSMTDEKLLMAVHKAISVYHNYTGDAKCFNWSSEDDNAPNLGFAGWDIQSCTEMVMPFCSNKEMDMHPAIEWNFTEFSDLCYRRYKIRPDENLIERIYGGKNIHFLSNVIFSNGLLDPWKSGSVTRPISDKVIVLNLSKSAHHLDLRASNKRDPTSVKRARKLYTTIFRKWIKAYYEKIHYYTPECKSYLSAIDF